MESIGRMKKGLVVKGWLVSEYSPRSKLRRSGDLWAGDLWSEPVVNLTKGNLSLVLRRSMSAKPLVRGWDVKLYNLETGRGIESMADEGYLRELRGGVGKVVASAIRWAEHSGHATSKAYRNPKGTSKRARKYGSASKRHKLTEGQIEEQSDMTWGALPIDPDSWPNARLSAALERSNAMWIYYLTGQYNRSYVIEVYNPVGTSKWYVSVFERKPWFKFWRDPESAPGPYLMRGWEGSRRGLQRGFDKTVYDLANFGPDRDLAAVGTSHQRTKPIRRRPSANPSKKKVDRGGEHPMNRKLRLFSEEISGMSKSAAARLVPSLDKKLQSTYKKIESQQLDVTGQGWADLTNTAMMHEYMIALAKDHAGLPMTKWEARSLRDAKGSMKKNPAPKKKSTKKKATKNKVTKKKVPWSARDIKGMQEFADRKLTKKKATKKKAAKKVARKKTPPYQLLINRCHKLWTHYCERPSKKRLEAIYVHLDKMKESTSQKVKTERSRCLRAANAEAKRLKYTRKK